MPTRKPRVLLVDDGTRYAELIEAELPELKLLRPRGARLPRASDGKAALRYLKQSADGVDMVLLDMHFDVPDAKLLQFSPPRSARRTRRLQGLRILQAIRAEHPQMPVLLLTSQEDLEMAEGDGALGARSLTYFLDGDDLDTLRIRIHAALSDGRQPIEDSGVFWGDDAELVALRKRLSMLARGPLPLLLEGETGTGKSFLAERFVHRNSGRSGEFVVLDLSTIPVDLVSAHLFGATRGAYTGAVGERRGVFEVAHGGTLFIDEIQNVPPEVQRQLLLVLQDGRVRRLGSTQDIAVDVKVVAASNQPLQAAVAGGRFRADLYMRLSPATRVHIPPLRERRGELPALCQAFAQRASMERELSAMRVTLCQALGLDPERPLRLTVAGKPLVDATQGVADALLLDLPRPVWRKLRAHAFPGNMRELSMLMHNLVSVALVQALDALHSGAPLRSARLQVEPLWVAELLQAGQVIGAALPGDASSQAVHDAVPVTVTVAESLNAVAQDVERQYLTALFQRHGGDLAHMAELLLGDTSRTRAVRLRMNQLGIKLRDLRNA